MQQKQCSIKCSINEINCFIITRVNVYTGVHVACGSMNSCVVGWQVGRKVSGRGAGLASDLCLSIW